MKGALEYLQGWSDLAICCRLIIATFLGSLIGWERISKRHNAGIRTFALVSLGAAVSTALNIKLGYIPGLEADVSRIPAGVISGIGFLGAGSILVTGRNQIKGLTTAASLWVCAAMGLVIGAGYLLVGIVLCPDYDCKPRTAESECERGRAQPLYQYLSGSGEIKRCCEAAQVHLRNRI